MKPHDVRCGCADCDPDAARDMALDLAEDAGRKSVDDEDLDMLITDPQLIDVSLTWPDTWPTTPSVDEDLGRRWPERWVY